MATKKAAAEKGAPTKAKKSPKVVIQYYHDGIPCSHPYQNKLSSFAYWYTRDIDPNSAERMGSKQFVSLLNSLGVENPRTEAFGPITLPNGVEIKATVGKITYVAPKPGESRTRRRTTRAQATQTIKAVEQAAALAEWQAGGEKGKRPATPDLDALNKATAKKAPAKKAAAKKAPATKTVAKKAAAKKASPFRGKVTPRPKATAAKKKTA